jgi:hypothetical protein
MEEIYKYAIRPEAISISIANPAPELQTFRNHDNMELSIKSRASCDSQTKYPAQPDHGYSRTNLFAKKFEPLMK